MSILEMVGVLALTAGAIYAAAWTAAFVWRTLKAIEEVERIDRLEERSLNQMRQLSKILSRLHELDGKPSEEW